MESTRDSMAWLARRDGSVLIGHGPFEEAADATSRRVAFHVQDFALAGSAAVENPEHRIERTHCRGIRGAF